MSGVLVCGASTPLGRALSARLLARGVPVLGVGREREAEAGMPAGVRWLQVDLTRPRLVRRLLFGPVRELGVTGIVHLAQHRNPEAVGHSAHRLHVDATRLMLHLAEHHPTVTRFVLQSSGFVYKLRKDEGDVVQEDAELNLAASAPQYVRDRVEADVVACGRMGLCPDLRVVVLRFAEILAPDMGSQLHDWLSAKVCVRPLGYDPMVDLLTVEDAARALELALHVDADGVFNVPGADVLPLSRLVRLWGRDDLPLPSPLVGPAYALRRALGRGAFRWDLNRWRFHFNGVLSGARAATVLGYVPEQRVAWPVPEGG